MFEALYHALLNFGKPPVLLGLILGTVTGIKWYYSNHRRVRCPSILMGFAYRMDPMWRSPLVALTSVTYTGGSMTAILINVPGSGLNVCTLIDGYPMTKKGQASRAMGAALTASALGGALSVLLALVMVTMVMRLVMAFHSPEMLFLIVLGLCFLGIVGTGSLVKGLISGGMGLIISLVGFQALTGVPRFTFGSVYFFDGINLICLVLGLLPAEAIELDYLTSPDALASEVKAGFKEQIEGAKDVFRHFWLLIRCTLIGYIVGILPGIGGETGIFTAYSHAKQTSRHPQLFGTGIVEGVIAPESANNAAQAGDLLCTLGFGIPGSAIMALMLGAFVMVGITPGPGMLTDHLDLSLTLLITIFFANILAGGLCFLFAPQLLKCTTVHPTYLLCVVLVCVVAGAFAAKEGVLTFSYLGFRDTWVPYEDIRLLQGGTHSGLCFGEPFEYYFFIPSCCTDPTSSEAYQPDSDRYFIAFIAAELRKGAKRR
jgi:TctA family transporter